MAEKKGFSLRDQIGAAVGSASIAAMGTVGVNAERTIETITGEILQLKTDAGNAIIGIGQRLIEAKELLPHGEWLPWLNDQVEFSERTAQDFMRLAREWSNPQTLADFGKAKALKLLLLPSAEREEFMQTHDVPNMSTRELEDAIRERDEARKRAEDAEKRIELVEAERDCASASADKLKERVKELESRPVDVAVQVDEEACRKAADEARRATVEEWQKKAAKLADNLAKAEQKLKDAKEKAAKQKADAEAGQAASAELEAAKKAEAEAKAEAERLREELEAAKREAKKSSVTGDAELATFRLLFEGVQGDINKMHGILLKVRGRDEALAGKLTAALGALAEKVKEAAK